jgi:hypothetical protein
MLPIIINLQYLAVDMQNIQHKLKEMIDATIASLLIMVL